jgi:hypothetical protein
MFVLAFALMLAAATATPSPALTTATPWWERFTFTMTGDGSQQGCSYQSSVAIPGSEGCGPDDTKASASPMTHRASSSTGTYTKITIERRFIPGTNPDQGRLEAGDTLLGKQVMALAIDAAGSVSSCEVVDKSGDLQPPYGCTEARSEHFETSALKQQLRRGYMTVLVYGHEEYPA